MNIGFLALWVGAPLVVSIAFVILLVLGHRDSAGRGLRATENAIITVIGSGAGLIALGSLALLALTAVRTFSAPELTVRAFAYGNAEPPDFIRKAPAIVDAGYDGVWMTVAKLPLDARWLLFLQQAMPMIAALAVSLAVVWLSVVLLRGRPFIRSMPLIIGIAAIAVLIGGLAEQVFASAARSAVVEFLDPRLVTSGDAGDGPYAGVAGWSLALDLAPVGWALGLALFATALQIGTRMQKDTEGLV